jgi:hypothetical protein
MQVGNDMNTKFCLDRWYSDSALASTYHHLYNVCTNLDIIIFQVVLSQGHVLQFTRQITGVMLLGLNTIYQIVQHYSLNVEPDKLIWRWNSSRLFSTKSAY